MRKTLGLDLGTNSLGWAILDDLTCDVLEKGVVIFPEGVDLDAGTSLETPAAVRRAARMSRRMKFRRKLRKWNLLKVLIENEMCPLRIGELDSWRKDGIYPLANKEFLKWLRSTATSNPYGDRAAAATERVDALVLGRALYHICQRRGFKSSRKEDVVDEETGELKQEDKKLGAVKSDMKALSEEIAAAGCKTLGQYFYRVLESQKDKLEKKRIRCRYTGRVEHYEVEFKEIMRVQGISEKSSLFRDLHKAIFMQRPLRSQKHLVGRCPLEPKSPRAQIGHPDFEEFRMLSLVNNLSFEDENGEYRDEEGNMLYPLTAEDRQKICSTFYRVAGNFKFAAVSKLFKKDERFKRGLRFHYYRDDDSLPSCRTRHQIRAVFGDVQYDEQKVFDALTFFNDNDLLRKWFEKHFPALDERQLNKAICIHPKEGNANYSLKAIRKILPFLRMGYELSEARFFAKLPDIVDDWESNSMSVLEGLAARLYEYRHDKRQYALLSPSVRKATPKPALKFERFKDFLVGHEWIKEEDWDKLYLKGDEEYAPETEYCCNGKRIKLAKPRLPAVNLGMIRNPLVQRSMTTLRRLVNYLAEHGKIDSEDTIRIELARSVNDFATRKAWQEWQKSRQQLREKAVIEIANHGVAATEDAIERYLLWEEQGGRCLYTGKQIPINKLFSGNEFDVEHTLPRSLSGDDSLANKTICEAKYNRETKKGMVPRSCGNWDEIDVRLRPWRERLEDLEKVYRNQSRAVKGRTDQESRCKARVKALTTRFELQYWRDKLKRFDMTVDRLTVRDGELGGFKKRQLVDAGIMSSHAVSLLKSVYPATYAVNGAATAFARKAWGLQGNEAKDRTDHTHHAVDAMVIAALSPSRFTAICTALKDDGNYRGRECTIVRPPCEGFSDKVRVAAGEILVKHVLRQTTLRQSTKLNELAKTHPLSTDPAKIVKKVKSRGDTVRGALHKDTFYGCISDPSNGGKAFVVRKSLIGPLVGADGIADKIVDRTIREIVVGKIAELKSKGVKNIEPGMVKMPSGVPINKVRIFAQTTNPSLLRDHAMPSTKAYKNPYYVTSAEGSNFRLGLFIRNGKRFALPDNSLDWAQNHKKAEYIPLHEQDGFIGYVTPGAMALACSEKGTGELKMLSRTEIRKRLYKVVKFRSDGLITLRLHTEARASVILAKDLAGSGKHKAGESSINLNNPHELLLLSPGVYFKNMIFEGVHFKMAIDGTITFL